ncbi:hypothetical protein ACFL5L_03355 [candidate division KSB1 bacterium]
MIQAIVKSPKTSYMANASIYFLFVITMWTGIACAWQRQLSYIANADSLFNLAYQHYENGSIEISRDYLNTLLEMPRNQRSSAAFYLTCRIVSDAGDSDSVLSLVQSFLVEFPDSKYVPDIHLLRAKVYYEKGLHFTALQELMTSVKQGEESRSGDVAASNFVNLFIPEMPESLYEEFKQRYDDPRLSALIDVKRAQFALHETDYERALQILDSIQTGLIYPGVNAYISEVREFIELELNTERYIVLLVPFSGVYREKSIHLYRGAQSALNNSAQLAPHSIRIKPLEIRGGEGTLPGIIKEIAEDPTILGMFAPLDPRQQVLATSLASIYKIPVILSDNSGEASIENNDFIFKLVGSPEDEGITLAQYAVNILGDTTFAILSPIDKAGDRMASSFALEVERLGGDVLVHEWYYPGAIDYSQQFGRIRRIGYDVMMGDSLRLFIREMLFDSVTIVRDSLTVQVMDSLNSLYMDSLTINQLDSLSIIFQDTLELRRLHEGIRELDSLAYPIFTYDAVFIPVVSPEELDYIVNQFALYNFTSDLLGNSFWYDQKMLDRVSPALRFTSVFFTSDYFIDDEYEHWAEFRDRFRAETGGTPGIDEMYGYDAMQFVLKGVRYGARSRQQFLNEMNRISSIDYSPRGTVEIDESGQKSNWMILRYRRGIISLSNGPTLR